MVLDLSYLNKDTPPEKRPKVLLLACFTCKSVEEIPYDDRFPNTDRPGHDQNRNPFLHAVVDRHGPDHKGTLADADLVIWQHPDGKRQITEQFQKGSPGLDVFGTNFYDTKDNYSADAMRCYAEHNRPQGQCSDYKSEKKVLKPETSKDRREAGLDPSKMPKMHLCDFCPVKSYNMKKFNESKGLYK
jgi:hypothetical protein